ncbi:coiled-coil domain-containing protein [Mycoplasmopsis glycophila]|uniref:ATPase involved in DNA repair n=1 Tax=Mycoplasmopsis glycophila TaxID=171285 RepID=A0A449AUP4_9BACT|nr:YkyA family protein [Mycoplasmopsis glycophila]VEU70239.1 ATPase involved in DNA repair [Mycoplasmopsis glycophila]
MKKQIRKIILPSLCTAALTFPIVLSSSCEDQTLKDKVKEYENQIETQNNKLQEIQAKLESLIQELEKEKAKNKDALSELETKVSENEALKQELSTEVANLEEKKTELQKALKNFETNKTELEGKKKEIQELNKQLAEKQESLDYVLSQYEYFKEENRRLTNQLNSTDTEIQALLQGIKLINKDGLFSAFFADLVDSGLNEYPSVFITRNAAQVFLSSFIQMIGQINAFKDKNKPYNDILYFIDESVWNYEKALNEPNTQRFNLEYLDDKYHSIFNIKNKEWNLEEGRISLINNTKYISGVNKPFDTFFKSMDEMLTYFQPYLDKGVKLFDFYIPEISWIFDAKEDMRNWIFKHANKIVFISDGNAQQYHFIENHYQNWALNDKPRQYSKSELLEIWNNFQQNDNVNKLPIDFEYFYTLEEKFKIYNLEKNYINSFNGKLRSRGKEWAVLNINQYPVDPYEIQNYLQVTNQDFINEFLTVNKINKTSFLDFIIKGREKFDPRKKNLIFIGSSLFKKNNKGWRINQNQRAYQEIQNYIAKLKELYPLSEYNYFFKLHPSYLKSDADEYIDLLFGTEDAKNSAILLDPTLAWEYLMSIDIQNMQNDSSILFNSDGTSKTELFGLQGTTTVLLTTMVLLNSHFGWDAEQIKTFVNFHNFPLSNTFNILSRDKYYENPDVAYQANLAQMARVYKYFLGLPFFPQESDWIDMRAFFKRQN